MWKPFVAAHRLGGVRNETDMVVRLGDAGGRYKGMTPMIQTTTRIASCEREGGAAVDFAVPRRESNT